MADQGQLTASRLMNKSDRLRSGACSFLLITLFSPVVLGNLAISSDGALTPLGQNATYMCTFTGGAIFESVVVKLLDIPNTALDTLEVDDVAILRARGIIFNDDSDTVTVFASEENNLTEVHCKEMQFPSNLLSETLVVTVIGPPLPPFVNSSVVDGTEIHLEWEEPFTWPDHDVLYYEVELNQQGSDEETTVMTNDTFHIHSSPSGGVAEFCQLVTFTVIAVSDLGGSEPSGSVQLGLPIAPGMFGVDVTPVEFLENGDPEVVVTVQAPTVCDYQEAELTVSITPLNSAGQTRNIAMKRYSSRPELTVVRPPGLLPNTTYNIDALVVTTVGNSSATSVFDTVRSSASAGTQPVSYVTWYTYLLLLLLL